MVKILLINGANLDILGQREPDIYGKTTLEDIKNLCLKQAQSLAMDIVFFQSNIEGEIVNTINKANYQGFSHIIINAGAYSHTSIAIMDSLKACKLAIYEVHISNIFKRESFRHTSYISKVATGVISGFGEYGYIAAINHIYLTKDR